MRLIVGTQGFWQKQDHALHKSCGIEHEWLRKWLWKWGKRLVKMQKNVGKSSVKLAAASIPRSRWPHVGGSLMVPLVLLLLLGRSLRLIMRLNVAVLFSLSPIMATSGLSRYCRSLWDWLIPGSFLWCRRRKKSLALLCRKPPIGGTRETGKWLTELHSSLKIYRGNLEVKQNIRN